MHTAFRLPQPVVLLQLLRTVDQHYGVPFFRVSILATFSKYKLVYFFFGGVGLACDGQQATRRCETYRQPEKKIDFVDGGDTTGEPRRPRQPRHQNAF